MDREKVIKGLECCIKSDKECMCRDNCPYDDDDNDVCETLVKLDALKLIEELLKEQEAVKPRVSSVEQRCGNCNKVIEMDGWKACPWCGKPILWKAVGRSVK